METPLLQIVNTLADLRALQPAGEALMIGRTALSDGMGGFYRWDSSDTSSAQDDTFMNIVTSAVSTSGRWVRVFQRARTTAGGVLVSNGGVKTYFTSGTTSSGGEITLNLTDDNSGTGAALFTEIWSVTPSPQTNATGPGDAVQSYRKALSANLKSTTYGFYKANAITLTLGLVYSPFSSVGAGTVVQFRVEGR